MRINIRGPQNSKNNQLLKIRNFSKKAEFTRSIAFLCTNQHAKKLVVGILPFTVKSNNIFWNNLTEEAKDLCNTNFKSPRKKIEKDIRKWRDFLCLLISRINIVRLTIVPKTIYKIIRIPIKLTTTFFPEIQKTHSKIHKEPEKIPDSQSNLKQKVHTILGFKIHYKAIVIKTAWYWHTKGDVVRWNEVEDPNVTTSNYSHLVFEDDAKVCL